MKEELWSTEDFFAKMESEGGAHDLAQWGCRPEQLKNKKLQKLWSEFVILHEQSEKLLEKNLSVR